MFKFYEIGLGNKEDKDFRTWDYEELYSVVIKATHYPTFEEVEKFLSSDLNLRPACNIGVNSITETSEWEVHNLYDDTDVENWRILK